MRERKKMNNKGQKERLWDYLIDMGIATENELQLVTCINGDNLETLENVLFARTGYRTLEQLENLAVNV